MALNGRLTIVVAPACTVNVVLKFRPGTETVPVVAVSEETAMRSVVLPDVRLAGNMSQKSVPWFGEQAGGAVAGGNSMPAPLAKYSLSPAKKTDAITATGPAANG